MIPDILFILMWFFTPVIWILIIKVLQGNILRVSILSVLLFFILLFQYIGLPILYFGFDEYRLSEVYDETLVLKISLFTILSTTLLLSGALASRMIFGKLQKINYFESDSSSSGSLIFMCIILFFICLSMLILFVQEIGIANVAGIAALGLVDSSESITMLRSSMTNNFEGNYSLYDLFFEELMLFSLFLIFSIRSKTKNFLLMSFKLIALIVTAISLTISAQKAPIMELFFGLMFIYFFRKYYGNVSITTVILLSPFAIFFLVLIYQSFMGSDDIFVAFTSVLSRTFTGGIHPIYVYLEYFPFYRDFLYGLTFPNPLSIFDFEPVILTQEIMAWNNPNEAKLGIVGSLPTIFWVEAYANFSIEGVVIISFIIGFILFSIDKALLLFQHNSLFIAYYVWLILFFKDLSQSFFSNYFLNLDFIVVTLIFLCFLLISQRGRIILN